MINYFDRDTILYFPNGQSIIFWETTKVEVEGDVITFKDSDRPYKFFLKQIAGYANGFHRERNIEEEVPYPSLDTGRFLG